MGYAISDLTIWRDDESAFEVFSGAQRDIDLLKTAVDDYRITDLSGSVVIALQGPLSLTALAKVANVEAIARLRYFAFCRAIVAGCECSVGRLGYTGEAGFEIVSADRCDFPKLWDSLSRVARPAGYRAAEILRIEAGFPLLTQEFRIPVFASELGLARYDCHRQRPARLKLISFRALGLERSESWSPPLDLARPTELGAMAVTSACYSSLAQGTLGLGFILANTLQESVRLTDPYGKFSNALLVTHPFYDHGKRRPGRRWQR